MVNAWRLYPWLDSIRHWSCCSVMCIRSVISYICSLSQFVWLRSRPRTAVPLFLIKVIFSGYVIPNQNMWKWSDSVWELVSDLNQKIWLYAVHQLIDCFAEVSASSCCTSGLLFGEDWQLIGWSGGVCIMAEVTKPEEVKELFGFFNQAVNPTIQVFSNYLYKLNGSNFIFGPVSFRCL